MIIKNIFIDPVEEEVDSKKEKKKPRNVKNVKTIENPNIEHHNHLEINRETRWSYLIMQLPLTHRVSLRHFVQQSILLRVESPITNVNQIHYCTQQTESQSSHKQLSKFEILWNRSRKNIETGWRNKIEKEMEDSTSHNNEVSLSKFRTGLSTWRKSDDNQAIEHSHKENHKGYKKSKTSAHSGIQNSLLINYDHRKIENTERNRNEANT